MRILDDKTTGLLWACPQYKDYAGEYQPIEDDKKYCKDIAEELNSWKTRNIREYITSRDQNLGDYILGYVSPKRRQYLAYEDGELVATVLMEDNSFLAHYVMLKGYVSYCESKNYPFGVDGCLKLEDAKRILETPFKSNNTSIDFLVVKGVCQSTGIGTRCIQSINKHLGFFSRTKNMNTINTFIHEDNIASQKVFERNGFSKPYRWYEDSTFCQGFDTYYKLGERNENTK